MRRRRPRPWRRGLPGLVALGAAMALTACSGLPCRLGAPAEFVSLGKNPFAAAQPTPVGRYLHTLEGWQGELYMGYGDYDENTGPIEVSAYNPRWSSYGTKLRFPTEAIELFRPIGDRLYAPAIDPRGDGPSAAVAVGEPDGRWSNNKDVWMTHVFDVATFDGTDLWLVGSRKTQAIAVRSRDGGRTWETALALEQNNRSAAIAKYRELANDNGLAQVYRDVATLRGTTLEFDTLKPEEVVSRLEPLAKAGNPWFGSAGELTALAYLKQGKTAEAGKLFAAIAADQQVPNSIRARAVQIAGTLGIDASASMPGLPQ